MDSIAKRRRKIPYIRKKNPIFQLTKRKNRGANSHQRHPEATSTRRFEGSSSKPDFLRFTFTDARRTKERTQPVPRHDGPALNFLHGVDGKKGEKGRSKDGRERAQERTSKRGTETKRRRRRQRRLLLTSLEVQETSQQRFLNVYSRPIPKWRDSWASGTRKRAVQLGSLGTAEAGQLPDRKIYPS